MHREPIMNFGVRLGEFYLCFGGMYAPNTLDQLDATLRLKCREHIISKNIVFTQCGMAFNCDHTLLFEEMRQYYFVICIDNDDEEGSDDFPISIRGYLVRDDETIGNEEICGFWYGINPPSGLIR